MTSEAIKENKEFAITTMDMHQWPMHILPQNKLMMNEKSGNVYFYQLLYVHKYLFTPRFCVGDSYEDKLLIIIFVVKEISFEEQQRWCYEGMWTKSIKMKGG